MDTKKFTLFKGFVIGFCLAVAIVVLFVGIIYMVYIR